MVFINGRKILAVYRNHKRTSAKAIFTDKMIVGTHGLSYQLYSDGEAAYCDGIGTATDADIIIGSIYNDVPVKGIDYSAFDGCNIASVVIPNSVKTIGRYAFYSCDITNVKMGESVEWICECSFRSCWRLSSIEIPKSVNKIDNMAFAHCKYLKRVDFSNHTSVPSLGPDVFLDTHPDLQIVVPANLYKEWKSATNWSNYADKIVFIPSEGLGYGLVGDEYYVTDIGDCLDMNIVIPPTYNGKPVTGISESAFALEDITSVVIPDSVTYIGDGAFDCCESLTSVITGDGVSEIGTDTFNFCVALTNIVLGDNIYCIRESAFIDCSGLEIIVMSEVMSWIEDWAFDGCSSLKRVDFSSFSQGDEPPILGVDAFSGTSSDLQIRVPKGDVALWKSKTNWSRLNIVEDFTN